MWWNDLIMDVPLRNPQQPYDAAMSVWIKIPEECLQHLVESVPRRIKTALKTKVYETLILTRSTCEVTRESIYLR